jgi:selenocysteine lyase/cysteine desulfurase
MGTGILIINCDTHPKSLIEGGTGSLSVSVNQPEILPDKYESGTPNLLGVAGLNEGVKFIFNKGIERIENYEMSLIRVLYKNLKANPKVILYTDEPNIKYNVSVLSFNIKDIDSESVAKILNDDFNIAVRAGLHCAPLAHNQSNTLDTGTVRVVISFFNTRKQVEYFIMAINKITKMKKRI